MSEKLGLPWPQVVLHVVNSQVDEFEELLFAASAISVTFLDDKDQPVLEPAPGEVRLWDELQLVSLFPQGMAEADVQSTVCNLLKIEQLPKGSFSMIPDQQWERVWMDQFKPMKFGEKLWICPTHLDVVDPTAINLRLDPGLAFGTGTHATTALCLDWLDENAGMLANKKIVDFGCGSGVLAVAALLLGADKVLATDIDPQAIQASNDNALLNNVAHRMDLVLTTDLVDNQCDILLANILFQPLCELMGMFSGMMLSGATIVMSGVLKEQVPTLIEHYADNFDLHTIEIRDGWARVSGERR